jgi:hypothetical protein
MVNVDFATFRLIGIYMPNLLAKIPYWEALIATLSSQSANLGDRSRSVSRRASRSLSFVFSVLIWSNIVVVVLGMVAFSGFRSIKMINLVGV